MKQRFVSLKNLVLVCILASYPLVSFSQAIPKRTLVCQARCENNSWTPFFLGERSYDTNGFCNYQRLYFSVKNPKIGVSGKEINAKASFNIGSQFSQKEKPFDGLRWSTHAVQTPDSVAHLKYEKLDVYCIWSEKDQSQDDLKSKIDEAIKSAQTVVELNQKPEHSEADSCLLPSNPVLQGLPILQNKITEFEVKKNTLTAALKKESNTEPKKNKPVVFDFAKKTTNPLIFVIDTSSSMKGDKIQATKKLVEEAFQRAPDNRPINVVIMGALADPFGEYNSSYPSASAAIPSVDFQKYKTDLFELGSFAFKDQATGKFEGITFSDVRESPVTCTGNKPQNKAELLKCLNRLFCFSNSLNLYEKPVLKKDFKMDRFNDVFTVFAKSGWNHQDLSGGVKTAFSNAPTAEIITVSDFELTDDQVKDMSSFKASSGIIHSVNFGGDKELMRGYEEINKKLIAKKLAKNNNGLYYQVTVENGEFIVKNFEDSTPAGKINLQIDKVDADIKTLQESIEALQKNKSTTENVNCAAINTGTSGKLENQPSKQDDSKDATARTLK